MRPLSRRAFLRSSFGTLAGVKCSPAWAGDGVVAGAIRWDAWYERADNSLFAQDNLALPKYHGRAPLHCVEPALDQLKCIGSQLAIDREIKAAAESGLKFWAFVWYNAQTSFRTAWNLYQQSSLNSHVNWCGIVTLDHFGSSTSNHEEMVAKREEWAGYMAQKNYQKVQIDGISGRPLLFVIWYPNDVSTYFAGNIDAVRAAFSDLRQSAVKKGLGSPYVVIMDGLQGASLVPRTGADAISNYIPGFSPGHASPYSSLDQQARNYWVQMSKTGMETIPIAIVGWDTRPRQEVNAHWRPKVIEPGHYYAIATPSELAEHVRAAISYINHNPRSCPSRVLLIYSWDECDEGGGLVPTLGDPNGTLLSGFASAILEK